MAIVCRSKCEHFDDCGGGICVATGNDHNCSCEEGFNNYNGNPLLPCGKNSVF